MKTQCKECSLPTPNPDALCDRCYEHEVNKAKKKKKKKKK